MSAVASSESSRFLLVCLASVFCAIWLHEDAAVEDALRFVVEDAVEIFVAGAMRLGVLDDHVVVGQLFAAREVKAVEDALQAFAGEVGADVVARKLRAERERVDVHVAGAAELRRGSPRCETHPRLSSWNFSARPRALSPATSSVTALVK